MERDIGKFMLFVLLLLGAGQVQADYWKDTSGSIWRNNFGECWHSNYWTPDMAVVGCDGKVAEEPKAAMPAAEPAVPAAPAPMMATDARVNFGFDRADLDADATAAIDTLVRQARTKGTIKSAKVTGHADRIGTEGYNQDLSLRRASAVSDYLVQRAGLDPQAVEIRGRGESEPLVSCEGQRGAALIRCLAPNRRARIDLDVF